VARSTNKDLIERDSGLLAWDCEAGHLALGGLSSTETRSIRFWLGGREAYCSGLENRQLERVRGFKSHPSLQAFLA
jgi:hypothetical protein